MKLSYFPKYAALNAAPVIDAFLHGARDLGMESCENSLDADAVLIWSQLWAGRMRGNQAVYQHYRACGKPIIMIDAGTLQRGHTWRVCLNNDAYLDGHGHDSERCRQLGISCRPWRTSGDHVLVALQRPDSNQWAGQPALDQWCQSVVDQLRQHTTRRIVIRPHPRFPFKHKYPGVVSQDPEKIAHSYDDYDFSQQLNHAWAVVNWNSSPGVVAALNGIPVFVGSSSLAAAVGNLDLSMIDAPSMPDREQWANDLAWTEWTVSEMHLGVPQQMILNQLRRQAS